MSKKMSEYHRLYKQLKVGLITWNTMTSEQIELMRQHYPHLFNK